jgi:proteasome lid subunit RPN8/RPN11
MKLSPVLISNDQIRETITVLREAGSKECVLLWLGRREPASQRIVEVYKPLQESEIDYFEIPRAGMAELMANLKAKSLYVVAQVHTHPCEAFHSPTDDRWAIVRHVDALSIVLPHFAKSTTVENFRKQSAVFYLSRANQWTLVKPRNLSRRFQIVP